MATPNNTGSSQIVLNSKTVSFVLGLIALGAAFVNGVNYINNYNFRLENLEIERAEMSQEIQQLNQNFQVLSDRIVDLTIALNSLEVRTSRNGE
jgi:hypothetical protein